MKHLNRIFSLALLSFVMSAGLALAQVATVFELTGTATAAATQPAVAPGAPAPPTPVGRALRKGDAVNQGETITTGPGSNIVLRFLDGQVVALAATSTFAINAYTYNPMRPESSNVLLSLVNGGMRAITGLIGKARPQAVAYRAGSATIGIRGTDLNLTASGGTVAVTVLAGSIAFTFNGQTITIPVGSGSIVTGSTGAPAVQTSAQVTQALQAAAATNPALQAVVNATVALNSTAIQTLLNAAAVPGQVAGTSTAATATAATSAATQQTAAQPTSAGGLPPCSSVLSAVTSGPNRNCAP